MAKILYLILSVYLHFKRTAKILLQRLKTKINHTQMLYYKTIFILKSNCL